MGFPSGSCKRAAQVVFGVGMTARESGATESKHSFDLGDGNTTAQQALSDPQVGNAPIGWGETLGDVQPVQPTGIDLDGCGRCGGTAHRSRRRRQPMDGSSRREAALSGQGSLQRIRESLARECVDATPSTDLDLALSSKVPLASLQHRCLSGDLSNWLIS